MQGSRARAVFAAMTGAGVLLGGAGVAAADQTFGVLETGATTSQLLTFDQFDPSLGTLTAVDITMVSSNTNGGGATAQILGGEGGNVATESLSGLLDILGPDSGVLLSEATSAFATCTVISGGEGCFAAHGQDDPTFAASPLSDTTDLAAFEGLGTVNLTASIDGFTNNSSATITDGSNNSSGGLAWSGDVSVSYDYAPIPEPASLALFGMGIAGLGMVRRRYGDAVKLAASAGKTG